MKLLFVSVWISHRLVKRNEYIYKFKSIFLRVFRMDKTKPEKNKTKFCHYDDTQNFIFMYVEVDG